ncbi:hypothetical protein V6Z12_D05G394300 [Gossypium hirsutum]
MDKLERITNHHSTFAANDLQIWFWRFGSNQCGSNVFILEQLYIVIFLRWEKVVDGANVDVVAEPIPASIIIRAFNFGRAESSNTSRL